MKEGPELEEKEKKTFFFYFIDLFPEASKEIMRNNDLVSHFTPLMLGLQLPWKHSSCCRVRRDALDVNEGFLLFWHIF